MNEAHRIGRAHRAQAALDEFLTPMFDALEAEYTARMIEIANTELSRERRTDKITALALALKIVRTTRSGMNEYVRDGELARDSKLRAQSVEKMTAPQRRLFAIGPQR